MKEPKIGMYTVLNLSHFEHVCQDSTIEKGDLIYLLPAKATYICVYPEKLPSLDALELMAVMSEEEINNEYLSHYTHIGNESIQDMLDCIWHTSTEEVSDEQRRFKQAIMESMR